MTIIINHDTIFYCPFLSSYIAAFLSLGCRASLLHCLCTLFDGPAPCLSLFCGMLFADSSLCSVPDSSLHHLEGTLLWSAQLEVTCPYTLIAPCIFLWAAATVTIAYLFVLSVEQSFLPRYPVSNLRNIYIHIYMHVQVCGFFCCLFVLFWQSFVFLMPKLSDRAWICQR